MGHDLGDFIDIFKGSLHIEYSGGKYVVWNDVESEQLLRLNPSEAAKLFQILQFGLMMYHEELI